MLSGLPEHVLTITSGQRKGPAGEAIAFRVVRLPEVAQPEHALTIFDLEVSDGGEATRYACAVPTQLYNDEWAGQFLACFCRHPSCRGPWRVPTGVAGDQLWDSPALAVSIPGQVAPAEVDEAIAGAVATLNRCGAVTRWSCSGREVPWSEPYFGTHAHFASIQLARGSFPPALLCAVVGAGFSASPAEIRVQAQLADCQQANRLFRQILAEWMDGTLDTTGRRYRVQPQGRYDLPTCRQEQEQGETSAERRGTTMWRLRSTTAVTGSISVSLLLALVGPFVSVNGAIGVIALIIGFLVLLPICLAALYVFALHPDALIEINWIDRYRCPACGKIGTRHEAVSAFKQHYGNGNTRSVWDCENGHTFFVNRFGFPSRHIRDAGRVGNENHSILH